MSRFIGYRAIATRNFDTGEIGDYRIMREFEGNLMKKPLPEEAAVLAQIDAKALYEQQVAVFRAKKETAKAAEAARLRAEHEAQVREQVAQAEAWVAEQGLA